MKILPRGFYERDLVLIANEYDAEMEGVKIFRYLYEDKIK